MTATVDVVTGERRLISYFFAPIVETVQMSLGERFIAMDVFLSEPSRNTCRRP